MLPSLTTESPGLPNSGWRGLRSVLLDCTSDSGSKPLRRSCSSLEDEEKPHLSCQDLEGSQTGLLPPHVVRDT